MFQFGHSKDRRPDLPQLKVNLSVLDPLGLPLTTTMLSGNCADDPLYVPEIQRVQASLGRRGLTFIGDEKMAALETRAFVAARGDYYLCPLAATQVTATVQYIGHGPAPAPGDFMVSVRVGTHTRGITYTGQETFDFRGLKSGQTQIQVGFAALQYKLAAIVVGGQDVTGQTLTLQPGDKLTNVQILITDEPRAQ